MVGYGPFKANPRIVYRLPEANIGHGCIFLIDNLDSEQVHPVKQPLIYPCPALWQQPLLRTEARFIIHFLRSLDPIAQIKIG